jgi:hypothetical protein
VDKSHSAFPTLLTPVNAHPALMRRPTSTNGLTIEGNVRSPTLPFGRRWTRVSGTASISYAVPGNATAMNANAHGGPDGAVDPVHQRGPTDPPSVPKLLTSVSAAHETCWGTSSGVSAK